jgi:hypothetical protein
MSSNPRPCYQNLNQYTQNGIIPVIAPTPSTTLPYMAHIFKPHTVRHMPISDYKVFNLNTNINK